MEDRIASNGPERPGAALAALAVILAITAAWWALALWPAGAIEPEWLARTRGACFGSSPGGLPSAGGWILLVGEPLGMLGMLVAIWGRSLRRELRWVRTHPIWRESGIVIAGLGVIGTAALGARVSRAWAASRAPIELDGGLAQRIDQPPPDVALVDQHGRRTSLRGFRGTPVMLTFAYGHCTTVCPTIIEDLRAARQRAGVATPLVILTMDPWRDTPDRLPMLAAHWRLAGDDRVLSGTVDNVERVLDSLGIGRRRDDATGDIEHGTTTMLVDRSGRIAWRIDGGARGIARLLARF